MKHSSPEMLLRIAQADAYCIACEFVNFHPEEPAYHELRSFTKYLGHPTYHKLKPGQYTDDSQMSIAVAEVLVDGNPHTQKGYREAFFECFKRDPRDGYSRGFQSILEAAQSPDHLKTLIVPKSDKNGAAMRSVPLGVFRTPAMCLSTAELQAKITHDTPGGILSSQAVALMSHFAMWEGAPLRELPAFLAANGGPEMERFRTPWTGRVEGADLGMKTAHAVCTLVSEIKSLTGILRQTIEWGGDTDSVASIAWGIASARMKEDVPAFMEADLEPGGMYGAPFLKDLGKRLMEAHG